MKIILVLRLPRVNGVDTETGCLELWNVTTSGGERASRVSISIVNDVEGTTGQHTRHAFVYRPGGLEYTIGCGEPPCASVAFLQVDPFTADFVVKDPNGVKTNGRQTLSPDGTMIVVTSDAPDAEGHHAHSIVVWKKEPRPKTE